MGIRCSLLGHRFTGTDVEEERREQGSEVVTVVREIEVCDRCGERQVVSENKEVTTLEVDDTGAGAESGERDGAPEKSAAEGETGEPGAGPVDAAPDIDAAEDDAELIEEAEGDAAPPDEPTADAERAVGDEDEDEEDSAAEDDAIILEDEDDTPEGEEREPGEWPEDEDATEPPGDEVAEWPDEDRGDEEWEGADDLTDADEPDVEPAGSATVTVPEGRFRCPDCGFTTDVESSSLREGDFCPECHRAALEHVPDDE